MGLDDRFADIQRVYAEVIKRVDKEKANNWMKNNKVIELIIKNPDNVEELLQKAYTLGSNNKK